MHELKDITKHRIPKVAQPLINRTPSDMLPSSSRVSPSPQLPIEIYANIIDLMDRPMLPVVALVAWAWYPWSMHNLYSLIELKSRTTYDLLVMQLRTSPRVQNWLATTRQVIVHEPHHELPEAVAQHHEQFLDAFPLVFATALPSLQQLEFQGLRSSMHPTFSRALCQFRDLTSLHLACVTLSSIAPFSRVVRAFPHLETLSVSDIKIERLAQASLPPQTLRTSVRLHHLHLRHLEVDTLRVIANWLVGSAPLCSSLRSVVVDYYAPLGHSLFVETDNPVDEILEASGSFLETFQETDDRSLRHGEVPMYQSISR